MDFWIFCCLCLCLRWVVAGFVTSDTDKADCSDARPLQEGEGDDRFVLVGSTAIYCASETVLIVNLSLGVPTDNLDHWEFRIELVNEDHNDIRFACDYSSTFVEWEGKGNATGRLTRLVKFDHVYSGDYVLHILRTVDSKVGGRVADRKYSSHLGRLATENAFHHVRFWNISIDIPPETITANSVIVQLRHFNNSKLYGFRNYQLTVRRGGIKTNVQNFTDRNIANENGRNEPDFEPIIVTGLSDGDYTLQIVPLDSRCNTPIQSVNSHCPEFCERQFSFVRSSGHGNSPGIPSLVHKVSGFQSVASIVASSTVLLILLVAVTILVLRRRSLSMGISHTADIHPTLLSASTAFQSVLLVYDIQDQVIKQKVRLFHQELLRIGIAKIYDFGDEDQREDVAIETVGWFPNRIQDPSVHIIVIESDGLVQCRKASMSATASLDGFESNILCHALEQIRVQEMSHRFLRYTRISVVCFEDLRSTSDCKLDLNPYTRFRLPTDMPLLTNQLFV